MMYWTQARAVSLPPPPLMAAAVAALTECGEGSGLGRGRQSTHSA